MSAVFSSNFVSVSTFLSVLFLWFSLIMSIFPVGYTFANGRSFMGRKVCLTDVCIFLTFVPRLRRQQVSCDSAWPQSMTSAILLCPAAYAAQVRLRTVSVLGRSVDFWEYVRTTGFERFFSMNDRAAAV